MAKKKTIREKIDTKEAKVERAARSLQDTGTDFRFDPMLDDTRLTARQEWKIGGRIVRMSFSGAFETEEAAEIMAKVVSHAFSSFESELVDELGEPDVPDANPVKATKPLRL